MVIRAIEGATRKSINEQLEENQKGCAFEFAWDASVLAWLDCG